MKKIKFITLGTMILIRAFDLSYLSLNKLYKTMMKSTIITKEMKKIIAKSSSKEIPWIPRFQRSLSHHILT